MNTENPRYRPRTSERLSEIVTVLTTFRASSRHYVEGQEVVWRRKGWNGHRVRVMIRRGDVFNGNLAALIEHLGPEESLRRGLRPITSEEFDVVMDKELERLKAQEQDMGETADKDDPTHVPIPNPGPDLPPVPPIEPEPIPPVSPGADQESAVGRPKGKKRKE